MFSGSLAGWAGTGLPAGAVIYRGISTATLTYSLIHAVSLLDLVNILIGVIL